jgi:hypothetical protein
MIIRFTKLRASVFLAVVSTAAFAQKVKVGYDKSVEFSKFASYTWAQPEMPSTRPLLYASIVGSIDYELKSKGLTSVAKDGDLILIPAGGFEFGVNRAAVTPIIPSYSGAPPTVDASMWVGAGGPSNLMAPYVPEGTLVLNFVDRITNKVIWTGSVKEKLDTENKKKSLEQIDKAIAELLRQYPPRKK